MTAPNLTVSSKFFDIDGNGGNFFDAALLDDFALDYQTVWDAIAGVDHPVRTALESDPTVIQSTRILWGNTTDGVELTGTGLGQVSNIEQLELALENGAASGSFDALTIYAGGVQVGQLDFSPSALTLTSGKQSLSLSGKIPTSFQDLFDFVGHITGLLDDTVPRSSALDDAIGFLGDFDLDALTLTDDGITLADLILSDTSLQLELGGAVLAVNGTFPADSLGAILELVRTFERSSENGTPITDLDQIPALGLSELTLIAKDGTVLVQSMGELTDLDADAPFGTIFFKGTDGNDRYDGGVFADLASEHHVDLGSFNDTVDAGGLSDEYLQIEHRDLVNGPGQILTIDGDTDTGSIFKGGAGQGITTLLGLHTVLSGGGLALNGSAAGDTFDITYCASSTGSWSALSGGRGNDVFILNQNSQRNSNDVVRLDFNDDNLDVAATQGLIIDLSMGTVGNDGFGGEDIIDGVGNVIIEVRGTDLADVMTGSQYDDRFIGRAGNDTIDGGGGTDAVRYDRGDMTSGVTVDLGRGTARGQFNGTAFADTLRNIEDVTGTRTYSDSLSGSNGSNALYGYGGDDFLYGDGLKVAMTGGVADQVYRLYQATLDRAPDVGGHLGWTTRIFEDDISLSGAAAGFVNSREFQNVYGALGDDDFVELLYENVLGRAADAGGKAGWVSQLDGGTARADVVVGFSESREFKNSTGADAADYADAHTDTVWTDDVYRLYRATLDRAPDEGGFLDWTAKLGSGTTLETAVSGFVNSREFQNTYGALDNDGFVTLLYGNVLDRAPDAGGLADWLGKLDDGVSRETVVKGFSQSREFVHDTAEDVTLWARSLGTNDRLDGGSGDNIMVGGILSDEFTFHQTGPGSGGFSTVVDLEAWDTLSFQGFGYETRGDVRSHMIQRDADVVFVDQFFHVAFLNTDLASISDDMIQI